MANARAGYGLRINAARCDKGLSQIEFCRALGVTQPTVSRWEQEKSKPSRASFEAMARLLGASVLWLQWGGELPPVKPFRSFYEANPGEVVEITREEHEAISARNGRRNHN